MSRRLAVWCSVLVCCLALQRGGHVPVAQAAVDLDIGFFYDRLAPYGHWVNHAQYGWVWYPAGVSVGWRPYTNGHWDWTDTYGWLWASDWEWGWAPFHYGRWAFDASYGWVWLPGTVWGPAWVSWRNGGGYIGWAPLPPSVSWEASGSFSIGHEALEISIGHPAWSFVEERNFVAPRVQQVIVPAARNVTVINVTKNVTNYVTVNNRVVNQGVSVSHLEQNVGVQVPRVQVQEASTVAETRPASGHADTVAIFHPSIKPAAPSVTPPAPDDLVQRHRIERDILQEKHQAQQVLMKQQSGEALPAGSTTTPAPTGHTAKAAASQVQSPPATPPAHPGVSQGEPAQAPQAPQAARHEQRGNGDAERQALSEQQQREAILLQKRQEREGALRGQAQGQAPGAAQPHPLPAQKKSPQQEGRPQQ